MAPGHFEAGGSEEPIYTLAINRKDCMWALSLSLPDTCNDTYPPETAVIPDMVMIARSSAMKGAWLVPNSTMISARSSQS